MGNYETFVVVVRHHAPELGYLCGRGRDGSAGWCKLRPRFGGGGLGRVRGGSEQGVHVFTLLSVSGVYAVAFVSDGVQLLRPTASSTKLL